MKNSSAWSLNATYRAMAVLAIIFLLALNSFIIYTDYNQKLIIQNTHNHGTSTSAATNQAASSIPAVSISISRELALLQAKQQVILYSAQSIILLALCLVLFAWYNASRRVKATIRGSHERQLATLQHLQLRAHENASLNKINEQLHTCHSAEDAYTIIHLTAKMLFPSLNGGLAIYDKATKTLKTVCQWGEQQLLQASFSPDDCWAFHHGHVYVVNETKKPVYCPHYAAPPGACIHLPLIVLGETIGLLDINSRPGIAITEKQQQLAIMFAESMKLALASINLRETLHHQAMRDGLTGLFNRRYLDETLPRHLEHIKRNQGVLSVAMIDIDGFKQINDKYGHESGDEVLKFIGKVLQQTIRAGDIACRLGGDEFLIVLIDSSLANARPRIKHICQLIKSESLVIQGALLPQVTLSAGIAAAPAQGRNAKDLLLTVDKALYAAKQAGKNCIKTFRLKKSAIV